MQWLTIVVGIVLAHAVVWGSVHQMRRDGYRLRRYYLAGFVAMEAIVGFILLEAGWTFFVFLAVNAGFMAMVSRMPPPKRPPR